MGGTGANRLAWHCSLRWSRSTDAQPDRNCHTTPNTYAAVGTWHIQAWTPANFNEKKTRALAFERLFVLNTTVHVFDLKLVYNREVPVCGSLCQRKYCSKSVLLTFPLSYTNVIFECCLNIQFFFFSFF